MVKRNFVHNIELFCSVANSYNITAWITGPIVSRESLEHNKK